MQIRININMNSLLQSKTLKNKMVFKLNILHLSFKTVLLRVKKIEEILV
jgi:hypothetical protein